MVNGRCHSGEVGERRRSPLEAVRHIVSGRRELERNDLLEQAGSGRIAGTAFEYEEMLVEVVGDTAVTMSRTRQEATIAGNDWSATLHVTDVWVRRDGTWQVIARHGSPLVGRGGSQSAAASE